MQYPLSLSFKIIALAPQIYVRDASGTELLYVKQKLLKLKEKINVFADSSQSRQLYEINADRVLDIAARYTFTGAQGQVAGSVKRQGLRSFWKATYEVADAHGRTIFTIEEENPWVKVLDGLLGEIPILGMLTGYFLNPRYVVKRAGRGTPAFRISKHRSFLESTFQIEELEPGTGEAEEIPVLLSILMMTLLERQRG
ncbi:MAG TPA: hypothetical protein VJ725_20755 [Thermoanaerobaculia bacterium]|nr:hypothetical protein [Thermoanaerobaculia bacterium]